MGIPDDLTCHLRNLCAGQEVIEPDMKQQTGSKLGKEYGKAVHSHLAYLTFRQSTSCEMMCWMNHRLESRLQEKYQQPQMCRWCHSNDRKQRGTKEPIDKGERGEWKSWLKIQHSNHRSPRRRQKERPWENTWGYSIIVENLPKMGKEIASRAQETHTLWVPWKREGWE